jgi:hypothetical protein
MDSPSLAINSEGSMQNIFYFRMHFSAIVVAGQANPARCDGVPDGKPT